MASRRSRRLTVLIIVVALLSALVTRVPTRRDASAFDFTFTDVVAGSYYELAVFWMLQEGITTGTTATTFSPDKTLERGELATFLYRFVGAPGNYRDHGFSDVKPGDFFHEAVKWLVHFELTTGTTPTTFSPHDPVTRGQVATFLYRLALTPAVQNGPFPFVDVSPDRYYYDAVRWMYTEGITKGTTPSTYAPDRPITRAEVAALLWRYAGQPLPAGVTTTTTTPGSTTSTSTTTTVFTPDLSGRPPLPPAPPKPPGEYVRFVSIPDFFNVDVGTIASVFDPSVGTCPDLPCGDSRTDELDTSIWYILESIAAEDPDAVLVAGDLVMGEWYADLHERQVFGPTETLTDKMAAVDLAGDVYYSQWLDRFAQRDLDVYPAVGDHELGNNDWPAGQPRSYLVDDYKAEFAEHFTEGRFNGTVTSANVAARPPAGPWTDTAYAFEMVNGSVKVLVVSLDVFYQQSPTLQIADTGTVAVTVRDSQLAWLEDLLVGAEADASIDHVIVQGHTPVLGRVRELSTSALYLQDTDSSTGVDTALWQLLSQYDVPLYLAGEVHRVTHSKSAGVHQVVHGGIIGSISPINYLVLDVYEDRLDMTVKELDVQNTATELWQSRWKIRREITIFNSVWQQGFLPTGYLEVTKNGDGSYSDSNGSGRLAACLNNCIPY
jgi:3',5'-cyclic AMP phosphodiesterase CpdA